MRIKIRDENAKDEMTMQYIDRLSDDAISGKDIRVFGLKKWIIGKYGIAIKKYQKTQCEEEYYRICRKIVGNHSDSWTGSDLLSVSDQPVEKWNVPDDVRIPIWKSSEAFSTWFAQVVSKQFCEDEIL